MNTGNDLILSSGNNMVTNNTIYQSVGDTVVVKNSPTKTTLANNIIWTDTGNLIDVASGSTANFYSDYNLFYLGSFGKSKVGSWAGTLISTLGTWQSTTGQDAHSPMGNPDFIDMAGADHVLGYTGSSLGDGNDDNFGLQKGSPAIDAGDSYLAPPTDIEGDPRHDDPSTPNTGTGWPLYVATDTGKNQFSTTGVNQNWYYNSYYSLTLPFAFTFYGTSYTTVSVSSKGFLQFAGPDQPYGNTTSLSEFERDARIAPLWDGNISTSNGIFVDTSTTGQVTIRWSGVNTRDNSPVNFSVTLFSNGTFRFDYGAGNTNLTPIVGVSAGNGYSFVLSKDSGQASLTSADSLTWSTQPGLNYYDIGAYEFQGNSDDYTPPEVVSVSNLPTNNGTTDVAFTSIQVDFSKTLDAISARSPDNYILMEAGPDGQFDSTAVKIPLVPTYTFPGTEVDLTIPSGVLPAGNYRLTLSGTNAIYDISGNALDGAGKGVAGTDYVTYFTIDRSHDALPVANAQSVQLNEDASSVITLTGSDADGFPLTYSIVQNPTHGTLSSINPATDTVTYTPDLYYNGTDSFSFSVDNGRAGIDDATVSLTVLPVNQKPTASNQSVTLNEGQYSVITLSGSDVETARDNLTFTLVTAPQDGTLTEASYGIWTYTPSTYYRGTDSFTYTVTDRGDPDGTMTNALTSTPATVSLTVLPVEHPPQAGNASYAATENTTLNVSAPGLLAYDTDVDNVSLTTRLITGPAHGSLTFNSNGSFTYTPAAGYMGSDSFTYVANDGQADSNKATVSITVIAPPVAANNAYALLENQPLVVAASTGVLVNDTDPNGYALTAELKNAPSHGSLSLNPDGSFTYTPSPDYYGSDSFTYQAYDGTLLSNTATVSLSVTWVNQAPVGKNNTVTIMENGSYTFKASDFGFSDPADTPPDGFLAVKVATLPTAGTLLDGSQTVSAGQEISVADINAGLLQFAPAPNAFGQAYGSFTFQVQDNGGTANGGVDLDQTPRTFTINVDVAPVAVNESYSTIQDTPLSIAAPGVLGGDTDANGYALTAQLITKPVDGTLVFNSDGSFTYTPSAGWSGADSFSYEAYDGIANSNTATVNLTVLSIHHLPVAVNQAYTTNEDTLLASTAPGILANDTDIDGNPLTASLVVGPSHGILQLNTDGSFTYAPVSGYSGSDSFTYQANDGFSESNVATVSLNVAPVTPTLDAIADKTGREGQTLSFTAFGHDADTSRALTYSLGSGAPAGATIDPASGIFTWTPAAGQGANTYALTVTATDNGTPSLSASQTFDVKVSVDHPPVATDHAYALSEDTKLTLTGPGVLAGDTDADGDSFTASAVTTPSHGTLTLNTDGSFTYTPTPGYSGSDSFTYEANDGLYDSNVATVSLNVTPVTPTLDAIADKTVQEQQALSFTASAHDTDTSRTLTYSLANGAPAGATINQSTGAFSWTPTEAQGPSTYTLTVIASDNGTPSLSASQTFHVTVMEDSHITAGKYANSGSPDTFTLTKSSSGEQVSVNGTTVYTGSLGTPLTFTGTSNNDTFVLDFSNGNPIPASGLTFQGGSGHNTIDLTGGTVSNVTDTFGTGSVTVDGSTFSYTNVQSITDNLIAQNRALVFGNGADTVNLALGSSGSTLSSNAGPSMTFANPGSSLTVATGSGNDTINVTGPKPQYSVVVDPGLGMNTITDTTGAVVARMEGSSGNNTFKIMQTTPKAVMVYVNNSNTACLGVNGFELRPSGRSQPDHPPGHYSRCPHRRSRHRHRQCHGLQGQPRSAQRGKPHCFPLSARHLLEHIEHRHCLDPGQAGGHHHHLLGSGPHPERHPRYHLVLAL